MTATAPPLVAADFQQCVDKYLRALDMTKRLLDLAPKLSGHPGSAAALPPAVVLGTTAAFEGFAEDSLAVALALQGNGLAQIAKSVGRWDNPSLKQWHNLMRDLLSSPGRAALKVGPKPDIKVARENKSGNWSLGGRKWPDVLEDSECWIQVRHLLTHGLVTGWRYEWWPPPLKGSANASQVLKPKAHTNQHTLDRQGALSCARIYEAGARHVATVVAADLAQPQLDWSAAPNF